MTITRNNTKSKSSLFLLELTIAIAFFALAAGDCVQLFVNAHILSRESTELNMAVIQAQSVAEAYKSVHGDGEKLARLLDAPVDGANEVMYTCILLFDSGWGRVTDKREAVYGLEISSNEGKQMRSADIMVYSYAANKVPIYKLDVKSYTGTGGAS